MTLSILDALRRVGESDPHRPLFAYHDAAKGAIARLSYVELALALRRVAYALKGLAAPGSRVALLLPNSLEYVIAFFAAQAAGFIPVPLMQPAARGDSVQRQRLMSVLDNCQPALLIVGSGESETQWVPGGRTLSIEDLLSECSLLAWEDMSPSATAFLQYTSGSTSNPKGVVVTHANLFANCAQVSEAMGTTAATVFGGWLPLFHDMGLIGKIIHPILLGASSHLIRPDTFLRHPRRWLELISSQRINISAAPNFAYDRCVEHIRGMSGLDLTCWTLALNGSEPVNGSTMDAFSAKFADAGFRPDSFQPVYGLAEATLFVSGRGRNAPIRSCPLLDQEPTSSLDASGSTCRPAQNKGFVSVGRPWLDCRVVVWNASENRAAVDGEVGEVMISGANCCEGYFEHPSATAGTFGVLLPGFPSTFLRSGDLGFVSEGELFVTGRSKDVLVIRGRNVYPEDIEDAVQASHLSLVRHGGAAVEVISGGRPRVVLVQELLPKATPEDERSLRELAFAVVSREFGIKLRDVITLRRGKLPKTTSGKIARAKVREMLASGELAMAPDLPSPEVSPRLEAMLAWWRGAATRIDSRLMDERRSIAPHWILEFGNRGFLGLLAGEAMGGAGLTVSQMFEVIRQVASVDLTLAAFLGVHNGLVVGPLMASGSPEQQARYLPGLVSGRILGCFALTEPLAGSNPRAVAARADRVRGKWKLSGRKTWIGTAAWSAVALFFAHAYDEKGAYRGMTAFLLPTDTPGVAQGPETLTMGMRAMVQNDLIVTDAELDDVQVLGRVGGGYDVAQGTITFGRLGVGVMALGCMQRALKILNRYSAVRNISTGKLADNPTWLVRSMKMRVIIRAVGELARRYAAMSDRGLTIPPEVISSFKAIATEECWTVVDATLQALGGRGYDEANGVPQMMRDARLLRIFEGPTETLMDHVGHAALVDFGSLAEFAREHLDASPATLSWARHDLAVLSDVGASVGLPERAGQVVAGEVASLMFLHAGLMRGSEGDAALRSFGDSWLKLRSKALCNAWQHDAGVLSASRGAQTVPDPSCEQIPTWCPISMNISLAPAFELIQGPDPQGSGLFENRDSSLTTCETGGTEALDRRAGLWLEGWIRRRSARATVTPVSSFADIGLDSIDAVELVEDLNEAFALELDPGVLWQFTNISRLSHYVATLLASSHQRAAEETQPLAQPTSEIAALLERELNS